MSCLESGREALYKDESTRTLCQKLRAMLPTTGQTGALLNTVTLAGVMYALKLIRDDESATEQILAIVTGNSTA